MNPEHQFLKNVITVCNPALCLTISEVLELLGNPMRSVLKASIAAAKASGHDVQTPPSDKQWNRTVRAVAYLRIMAHDIRIDDTDLRQKVLNTLDKEQLIDTYAFGKWLARQSRPHGRSELNGLLSERWDQKLDTKGLRSRRAVARANILTLRDLTSRTEAQMLAIPGFGPESLTAFRDELSGLGLRFGMKRH